MTIKLSAVIPILAIAATQIADAKAPGVTGSDWSQIRAEYERHKHSIVPGPDGWHAPNRSQQWLTRFDGRGFTVEPNHGGWRWGLALRKYGFEGAERGIDGTARVSVSKDRATYDWGAGLEEWYHNSPAGLEHGYTFHRRPEGGGGPLRLKLTVRGGLRPKVAGGTAVAFVDAQGGVAVSYSGLKVTDATGRELSSWFTADWQGLRLEVDEHGASYPVTIDPTAQQAYLKPAAVGTTQAADWFGASVAISGDTLVVGAPLEDSSTTGVNSPPDESAPGAGAVYVFTRTSGVWSQQAYLKPAAVGTTQAGDSFGWSVAISGDTLVVGAPYEDSSTTGVNSPPNESAPDAGAVHVFTRTSGVWSQQAYLKPAAVGTTQAGDQFGISVAISGDTLVVGAPGEDSSTTGVNSTPNTYEGGYQAGAAYVFTRASWGWSQQAYLKPAAVGVSHIYDGFGSSVAISGDTLVVGAPGEDSSTTGVNSTPNDETLNAGAVFVFRYGLTEEAAGGGERGGGTQLVLRWSQQAYLKPAAVGTTQAGDFFGRSVAISGDTLVVGAPLEASSTTGVNSPPNESAPGAGAVYVFTRTSGVWSQQAYLKPAAGMTLAYDRFGDSVAISGDTLVVGAPYEDSSTTGVNSPPNDSAPDAGAVYVFTRTSGVWSQQAYLKPAAAGTTQAGDSFGRSVAISGDTLVVGAPYEDSSTTGVNSTPNELATDAGAVYVFTWYAALSVAPSGTPQSAVVNTAFATALQVTVTDSGGNPVSGVTVNFTAPASGAGAVLSSVSAVTNGNGVASVNATANATAGSYLVTASVPGVSVVFSLTNLPQTPVGLAVVSGGGQSTQAGSPFAQPLSVKVADASGFGVPGITVTFTPPPSGASAILSAGTATTDASGIATVTATANTTAGTFAVSASAAGLSTSFTLTNLGAGNSTAAFLAPANNSTLGSTIVSFQWTQVTSANRYELRVIKANTPQQFRVEVLGSASTNAIYTLPSGNYRAEIRSCDASGCSAPGITNFIIAGGGVPSAPPTGLSCNILNDANQNRLNCSWAVLPGAHFYFVNVVQPNSGPGGGALTVAGQQVGTNSISVLIPNGQASVLVRGCTGDGCGPFSPALGINPSIGNPTVPILGEPFAGSSVDAGSNAPQITFSWNRVAGDNGSNYRYRLYVQDFSRNAPALDVLTTSNFYAAYFNPGTRYDALVIATPVAGGASRQGPPSAFLTRGRVPKSPVVTAPVFGSTVSRDGQGRVTVTWTPLVDSDGTVSTRNYQYYLAGPGQPVSGVTTQTSLPLTLAPGSWLGTMRACTTGTSCTAGSETGWGPWNNQAGSEGGMASFTVQ